MAAISTRGIDHFGFTVADLDQAIADVQTQLGGTLRYTDGPITEPVAGWMAEQLGTRGPFALRLGAMTADGLGLEILEYAGDSERQASPEVGHPGSYALLHRSPDAAVGEQTTVLPSGIPVVVQAGTEALIPAVFLAAGELDAVIDAMAATFGLAPQEQITVLGVPGRLLADRAGTQIALLGAPGDPVRLASSDLGAHHLAFGVDDVDGVHNELVQAGGFSAFGEPQTFAAGPLKGARWNYIAPASGPQLEFIRLA